ncbi:MAG: hypothetical protein O3C20_17625 [Verrucomicrobia bacterium]|nr:hypothetical protein [Verrucomicrobiota bacterium]
MCRPFRHFPRLVLLVVFCFPFVVHGQDPEPPKVPVDILIGPDVAVSGGGPMAWDGYFFPNFSSTGRGIFKARFLETDMNLPVPKGGYALLELTGLNSAQLLLRDLDLEYKSIQFDPFSSTTTGLIYAASGVMAASRGRDCPISLVF